MHLLAQAFNLARGRLAPGVASEALLARFKKFLRPFVINALGNALTAAQLGDGFFTTQAIQYNTNLFFRRILLACCPADVLDRLRSTRLSCL